MTAPWSFGEAVQRCSEASRRQQESEEELKHAYRHAALAEEEYRLALAKAILAKHHDGAAWTVAPDLARGDEKVAELRRERDTALGLREALSQAAWRRTADRKDAQRFADWSQRREMAEAGIGQGQPAWSGA